MTSDCPIFLIGMPGAGKSTLGVLLAKTLARPYVDTDLLIQQRAGKTLQACLDQQGYLALRALEEKVLLESDFSDSVVATGGSVVYSDKGMERLGKLGIRIYLNIAYDTMTQRVCDSATRGLACAPGTSMKMLYDERKPLYMRYADHIVNVDNLDFEQSLSSLIAVLSSQ
ncbi:MAG: shikimate kinase [Agarilytica sp.]